MSLLNFLDEFEFVLLVHFYLLPAVLQLGERGLQKGELLGPHMLKVVLPYL
jgi:hypothetical protein